MYESDYRPNVLHLMHTIDGGFPQSTKLKRVAYICIGGEVKYTGDVGYSSVTTAFLARPKACQYCVFEQSDGVVLLVDMYDLRTVTSMDYTVPDKAVKKFPTAEAAVMYAVITE